MHTHIHTYSHTFNHLCGDDAYERKQSSIFRFVTAFNGDASARSKYKRANNNSDRESQPQPQAHHRQRQHHSSTSVTPLIARHVSHTFSVCGVRHTYIHIYKYVCVCACGCAQRSITSLLCCRWPVNWRKSSKTHKKVCKAQQQFVWLHRNYNNTTIQI